jgi:hypothetical protein
MNNSVNAQISQQGRLFVEYQVVRGNRMPLR